MEKTPLLKTRIAVVLLIAVVVLVAVIKNSIYLALTGIFVGILFLFLAKARSKEVLVDERVKAVSGSAAHATYAIVTIFLAVLGLFSILSSRSGGSYFEEAIGFLLCYIAMLLIAIYSISYYYFNKKNGGNK